MKCLRCKQEIKSFKNKTICLKCTEELIKGQPTNPLDGIFDNNPDLDAFKDIFKGMK